MTKIVTYLALTSAAVVALTMAPTVATGYAPQDDHGATLAVHSALRDLRPGIQDPTDGARSELRMTVNDRTATFKLTLRGLSTDAADRTFGAHLHRGPCVPGDGPAALGHYNVDVIEQRTPVVVSPDTEVWLDFTVSDDGTARSRATVPFAPGAGDRSIVIHRDPTDASGTAGPRLACLPVVW